MKKLLLASLAALALPIAACTDASVEQLTNYGEEAKVVCFSGGQVIFDDMSTGRVQASDSGAGLYFRSKTSGRYVRTYADCIITN